jgi:NADH dehydrogenase
MKRAVVTGAFSNIGSAAARHLEAAGFQVHTLTNRSPPPGTAYTAAPLRFDVDHLAKQLQGAEIFVNTYWIRLPHAGQSFDTAVANNRTLMEAASRAGVSRFVHVSVSNPELGMNLGYYRGKAQVESALRESGLGYGIVRPTLVVSSNDVLTNNIAWFVRRFPVFPMPQGGAYRLRPVTLEDTGRLICQVAQETDNCVVDAAGPDVVTFREYVEHLAHAVGVRRWMPSVPNWLSLAAIRMVEPFLRDTVLTREELLGLQQELLMSESPIPGAQSVVSWLDEHGGQFGASYINDMHRHFGRNRRAPLAPRWKTG